jgi:nucleoside-diphosphate-sugar epimerase
MKRGEVVMRVFLTGATGWVGSAIAPQLINAGHRVLGLARNDAAAQKLKDAGVEVHRGDLEDLDSLRRGVAATDAVIHTAFIHDFANFKAVCEIEKRAIEALGSALVGSERPLLITSGTALVTPSRLATENDESVFTPADFPRVATEHAAIALAERGVRISWIRLSPSVHGEGDHGFVPMLIQIARDKGVSAFVGDGLNRWTAVHRLDAGHLYRLALEKGAPGTRYHAVDEEGIAFRDIAAIIGSRLNIPVVSKSPQDAVDHFGWFVRFAQIDCPASSKLTQERLGWKPTQPGLLAELEHSARYFQE